MVRANVAHTKGQADWGNWEVGLGSEGHWQTKDIEHSTFNIQTAHGMAHWEFNVECSDRPFPFHQSREEPEELRSLNWRAR